MFGWGKPKLVEHLEVKPEDAFIVSTERALSCEQREAITNAIERFRRGELKTLVLEKGFRITVLSQ